MPKKNESIRWELKAVVQRDQDKNRITVGRVAEYCLVSPTTVRRWIKDRKLSAIQLPSSHYRVSIADFEDFLKRYDMPIKGGFFKSESEKEGGEK